MTRSLLSLLAAALLAAAPLAGAGLASAVSSSAHPAVRSAAATPYDGPVCC